MNINVAGPLIVAVFFLVWIGAVLNWKLRKLDRRYGTDQPDAVATEPG